MTHTPTPAEIETLRDGIVCYDKDRMNAALVILDRLSPPEPEQPDEATVWARKVLHAHQRAMTPPDSGWGNMSYEKGSYDHLDVFKAPRTALSELIASKDAEIADWQAAYNRREDDIRELQSELASKNTEIERWKHQSNDWQKRGWELGSQLDKSKSDLAALRAENERLSTSSENYKKLYSEYWSKAAAWYSENERLKADCARLQQALAIQEGISDTVHEALWEADKAAERNTAEPATESELAALRAENERLRELLRWAHDTLYEINPSNYDHDEVCKLNSKSVEVILGIAPEIGETHGKSPEWWAERNTVDPVAVIRFARDTPGRENEMPKVISCNWQPDGEYLVYLHPSPKAAERNTAEPVCPTCKGEWSNFCSDGFHAPATPAAETTPEVVVTRNSTDYEEYASTPKEYAKLLIDHAILAFSADIPIDNDAKAKEAVNYHAGLVRMLQGIADVVVDLRTEAEARGRREALEAITARLEWYRQYGAGMIDQRGFAASLIAELKRMMTGGE